MAHIPTWKDLTKYWFVLILVVVVVGSGVGKLGEAKLVSEPTMLIMDQTTKTQIVSRLDQDDVRLNNIDSRINTVETRVDQIDHKRH